MHGAAVTLAQQVLAAGKNYDLFLADDMMDVAVFSSLVKANSQNAPIYTYFHENQISYPVSPVDTDSANARDMHYGYVNFTSALVSDKLLFNSKYHQRVFIEALPGFLSRFPDYNQKDLVPAIADRTEVLPLGMDLRSLDACRPDIHETNPRPVILWNHRWEYDKCPGEFARLLLDLHDMDLQFDVVLLGERSERNQPEIDVLADKLGKRILWNGKVEDFKEYAHWLWKADIMPVTSIHDFFGGSVIEAVYCQCHVLLPDRLAYPEHVADRKVFYSGYGDLLKKTHRLMSSMDWRKVGGLRDMVFRYDWTCLVSQYDRMFESVE